MFRYQSAIEVLMALNEARTIVKNTFNSFIRIEPTTIHLNNIDTSTETPEDPFTIAHLNTLAEKSSIKSFAELLKKTLDEKFNPDRYITKLLSHITTIDASTVIELQGLFEIIGSKHKSTQLHISQKIEDIILSLDSTNIDILEKSGIEINCLELIAKRKNAIEISELEKTYCMVTAIGEVEE